MQRKALALLLASALSLVSPPRAAPSALSPEDVAALIRAMLAMVKIWNAMNTMPRWEAPSTRATVPLSYIFPYSISPYSAPWRSMPWGWNGFSHQGAWPRAGYPFVEPRHSLTQRPEITGAAARQEHGRLDLSGVWQGASGDVLVIHGNGFRIHNAEGLCSDVAFHIVGSQFFTYAPSSGVTRRYDLAQRGDQLALRDSEGQVLLFQRLRQPLSRYKKCIIM
jgi:hypothetical protein